MKKEVSIEVHDREDSTSVKVSPHFYGRVELVFQDGVLQNAKTTATKTKKELKCNR